MIILVHHCYPFRRYASFMVQRGLSRTRNRNQPPITVAIPKALTEKRVTQDARIRKPLRLNPEQCASHASAIPNPTPRPLTVCTSEINHPHEFNTMHHALHQITHELFCARDTWVPTLPTRPLVLRTLVLPSVLRRMGDERLPTDKLPIPLPLFVLGVFGLDGLAIRSDIGRSSSSTVPGRFSTSLSVGTSHLVVVVVVVVHETALRFPLRLTGD